jgi:hypothetical protein
VDRRVIEAAPPDECGRLLLAAVAAQQLHDD